MLQTMHAFTSFRRNLETGHQREIPGKDDRRETWLLRLPTELLLQIVDLLPPVNRACLAVCNKSFYQTLNYYVPTKLGFIYNTHEIAQFIDYLVSDLPGWYRCPYCSRIHHERELGGPKKHIGIVASKCQKAHGLQTLALSSQYVIGLAHIRLAIKEYNRGKGFGLPIEYFVTIHLDRNPLSHAVSLHSFDMRIIDREVVIRHQHWVLIQRIVPDIEFILVEKAMNYMCPHINFSQKIGRHCSTSGIEENGSNGERYYTQAAAIMGSLIQNSRSCDGKTLRCRQCAMEFQIEFVQLGKRGKAICVTQWLNLGAGLSVDDPKWKSHLSFSTGSGNFDENLDIKRRYEEAEGRSMGAITKRNLRTLLKENCGRVSCRVPVYREGSLYHKKPSLEIIKYTETLKMSMSSGWDRFRSYTAVRKAMGTTENPLQSMRDLVGGAFAT